jgi:hypothetical protein
MAMPTRAQLGGGIALAYVRDGVVTLADADGNALVATGPNIPVSYTHLTLPTKA